MISLPHVYPCALLAAMIAVTPSTPCVAELPPFPNDQAARGARAYREAFGPVSPRPDGLIICEGEEFDTGDAVGASDGWRAMPWGTNYYAATFANTFLSRKAYLGAPAACDRAVASIAVRVRDAGRYLVLARYEAAYRFETRFTIVIEQNGQRVFRRDYGARQNVKLWAFGKGLVPEVAWDWGASENIVWEGHDAFAELKPGPATVRLIADRQPEPAARRNVDLVMLTLDADEVKRRVEKERYLPLDGLLTQSGDVWMRVTNTGDKPLTFGAGSAPSGGNWQQHSPYWVHLRNWPKPSVEVAPGRTSAWVEVGGTMDTLNDGQWNWKGDGPYTVEFGLRTSIGEDGAAKIKRIATFSGSGALPLAACADTRYTARLRHQRNVPGDLLDYLNDHPSRGRLPTETLIYGYTFQAGLGDAYDGAVKRFREAFALTDTQRSLIETDRPRGYIDVRSVPTTRLAEHCRKLGDDAARIACVSLGDEITLPQPRGEAATEGFVAWLKQRDLSPEDLDPGAGGDWSKIVYAPQDALRDTKPGLFYWSRRYAYHHGIQAIKQRTDILREHLPNAHVGANFSPHYPTDHAYLGEVHKWVTVFRAGGMTMPWSEDYIWQMPVATPQVNHISLDLFRAGLRHHPDRPIHFYVMPHAPNNTPRQWRRLFYGAVAHGARIFNLFEFRPVHAAYTENHVDDPAMYLAVRTAFRELGVFEKIVQTGRVRAAQTALWFSETGDIWSDSSGSFAAAKRSLYTAIRHRQAPLDVVVEADATDGALDDYRVLYLTDAHVSGAASEAIAAWVRRGGRLFLTAGAGMFDEYNRPNRTLRQLAGVEQTALEAPADRQIKFIKQDLPFSEPIDALRLVDADAATPSMPVIAVRSVIDVTGDGVRVLGAFADGKPAVTRRDAGGGRVTCCAFLPGLSYYHPAVPRRPVDRGATDDAFVHLLPTDFHPDAAALIAQPLAAVERPVVCSEPLVESTVIESPHGVLIPLINWTGEPVVNLSVTLGLPEASSVSLASGRSVKVQRIDDRAVLTLDLAADADALIVR